MKRGVNEMKFHNAEEINQFIETCNSCEGLIWLEGIDGSRFVLNSKFSRYVALAQLLTEEEENLELFAQLPEDKARFIKFFQDNPNVN